MKNLTTIIEEAVGLAIEAADTWTPDAREAIVPIATKALLDHLRAAGYDVLPCEATEKMIDAHFAAHAGAKTIFAGADEIWRAMVAASREKGRDDDGGAKANFSLNNADGGNAV